MQKNKANAELIASAPKLKEQRDELLEALTNLIENAEFDYHNTATYQLGMSKKTSDLIKAAQAAIDKATK